MKRLDLYIFRRMISTFVFILGLLITISVVIDFSEKVDNFMAEGNTDMQTVLMYYVYFIPYISSFLAPFFVLVAVIFFTSKMAGQSEFVAMTASGISFYRLLLPYMMGALFLGGILLYANHYWVPKANAQRIAYEDQFMRRGHRLNPGNVHRRLGQGEYFYAARYQIKDSTARNVTLEQFDGARLEQKIFAKTMTYNKTTNTWSLTGVRIRNFHDNSETIQRKERIDTLINMEPGDLEKQERTKDELTTPELNHRIESMKEAGEPFIAFFQLEYHRRNASAFGILILTVIGYSIASRKRRGGMGIHIVAALLLSGIFVLLEKFSTSLTINAGFSPFLGMWLPNFVFVAVSVILVRFIPK